MKDIDFISLKNILETAGDKKDEKAEPQVLVPVDLAQRILERMTRH